MKTRANQHRLNLSNINHPKVWFQVLQTTQASQTAVMTLKPGASTGEQPESHEKSEQILLLIDGELVAEIGQERKILKSGDVVIIPAGTPHKFSNEANRPASTFNVYNPPEYSPDEKG